MCEWSANNFNCKYFIPNMLSFVICAMTTPIRWPDVIILHCVTFRDPFTDYIIFMAFRFENYSTLPCFKKKKKKKLKLG